MMNNRTTLRKAGKAQQGTFSPHNGNPSFAAKAPSPDPAPPSVSTILKLKLRLCTYNIIICCIKNKPVGILQVNRLKFFNGKGLLKLRPLILSFRN